MNPNAPKVAVVGATYVDMAVRCEQLPVSGKSVTGTGLSYAVSGPGPNEAVQIALCRANAYLISKVGGDHMGKFVKDTLSDYKVNCDYIFTAEAKNTGLNITIVNSEGENASCNYCGANSALTEEDIKTAEKTISESEICLIHGQLPENSIIEAIHCAKIHNKKVILNPTKPLNGSGGIPGEYFLADVLVANLYEAGNITEISDANIRDAKLIGSDLVARGAGAAVITMGRRGCMVVDRTGADHIKAFIIDLVDHNGTGDAFAGAFAAFMAVDSNIREAAKFASAAGALACTKFGALESLPNRADIIEMLQSEDMQ